MQAINNAASALGLLCKDGIVLAVEKRAQSKLLEKPKTSEKMYKIDSHVACAVAGLTADANILLRKARLVAQRHRYKYQEEQPVEQLIESLCNTKQSYTQYGGLRPFGVAFLFAGWDKYHGFQLYLSDPSGNYGGWNATAIGNNNQIAKDKMKKGYEKDMSTDDALVFSVKVLAKTMDVTASGERMEFATLKRGDDGDIVFHVLNKSETEALLKKAAESGGGDDDDDKGGVSK
eukprot:g1523.t1